MLLSPSRPGWLEGPLVKVFESVTVLSPPILKPSVRWERVLRTLLGPPAWVDYLNGYGSQIVCATEEIHRANRIDLVHVDQTLLWPSQADALQEVPRYLDAYDLVHINLKRSSRLQKTLKLRFAFWLAGWHTRRVERRALQEADVVGVVSDPDRIVAAGMGASRVVVVPNGVDSGYFTPGSACETPEAQEGSRLLFFGKLDYFPNSDAVKFFAEEILPLIRAKYPSACLDVVGVGASGEFRALEGVNLIGQVDDLRPWLQRASVVVVPLRVGSGSRLKILEAFSSCKAVVSTTVGAEGLDVINGLHLEVVDDPVHFAQAVIDLIEGPERRLRLGISARYLVEKSYDWSSISIALEDAYRLAVRRGVQG